MVVSNILSPTPLRHAVLAAFLFATCSNAFGQAKVSASGSARGYSVERWRAEEGLPNQSLSELMVGRDGYLWIGSLVGVSRFDGVRFTPVLGGLPEHQRSHIASGW